MSADQIKSDGRVSFTVPASGRRYTIHVDDWPSIKLHMEIAEAIASSQTNSPPSTSTNQQQ